MSTLQLCLPYMMVCVHEARRDQFSLTVDDFGFRRSGQPFTDFGNQSILDQQVGVLQDMRLIVRVVLKNCTSSQQDGGGRRTGHFHCKTSIKRDRDKARHCPAKNSSLPEVALQSSDEQYLGITMLTCRYDLA